MKKRLLVSIFLAILVLMALPACAKPASAPQEGWPESVLYGYRTTGSDDYFLGLALARLLEKYSTIKGGVMSTGSAITVMEHLKAGRVQLNAIESFDAVSGWMGENQDLGVVPLRTIHAGDASGVYFFTHADSTINSVADLRGKTLMIMGTEEGAPGHWTPVRTVLESYGIDLDKDLTAVPYAKSSDMQAAIREKKIDAAYFPLMPESPNAYVADIHRTEELKPIPYSKEAVDYTVSKLAKYGFLEKPVPAYTLQGMNEPYYMASKYKSYFALDSLPDSLVYEIVKVIYEHWDEWSLTTPLRGRLMTLDKAPLLDTIPYHPGAIKYFKEKDVWTRDMDKRQEKLLAEEKSR